MAENQNTKLKLAQNGEVCTDNVKRLEIKVLDIVFRDKIKSSRRKTKQFSSYFRFPTSHTTVRAVPHTAVPILDTNRDTTLLK